MSEETIYRDTLMQLVMAFDTDSDVAFIAELRRARRLLGLILLTDEEDAVEAEKDASGE